jgi:hypothetical protein
MIDSIIVSFYIENLYVKVDKKLSEVFDIKIKS